MSKLDIVVGGQFGSESKGRVALSLVNQRATEGFEPISVRVAGPNAGHVVHSRGTRFAMRQLPVGFVNPDATLVIAEGSEIDYAVLREEVELAESRGFSVRDRLYIDQTATVLEPEHREQEAASTLNDRVGSTASGVGAARADRIWRRANLVQDQPRRWSELGMVTNTGRTLRTHLSSALSDVAIVIEGTQGYGLGQHAGFYPQCTSSNCRAIDFAAMAGITPTDLRDLANYQVTMVVRPYPIRVAGNSGPLAQETGWDSLELPEEYTTVTGKVRRVGRFDRDLVTEALLANGQRHTKIAFAMADQLARGLAGATSVGDIYSLPEAQFIRLTAFLSETMGPMLAGRIVQMGTGPSTHIDIEQDHILDLVGSGARHGGK